MLLLFKTDLRVVPAHAGVILNGNPNVAIIAPKGSNGAYVENLADKAFKKQREFLLNKENNYKILYKDMDITICIVEE